jgi:hypothetical protein
MKVFAVGRGQYENIGDLMLRRQLLDWVRPADGLHVYMGNSPPGYDAAMHLGPDDVVYRSLQEFYRAAIAAALTGQCAYVFKPGEIQLTLVGMKEHLSMLPLLAILRLRGGSAVRAGVGTRNHARLPRALMRPSIALSDLTLWRDVTTRDYMGTGAVMPDLAFAEGGGDDDMASFATTGAGRDALVVSMRGDDVRRPYPGNGWIEGVRRHAKDTGLHIWTVTQVRGDDERSRRLAADLGGEALTWPPDISHDVQEMRLRELYARTSIVLSDRLHVLIAAFTEGAVPVGSLVRPTDKVDRHFRTIGVEDILVSASGSSAGQVQERLGYLSERRFELFGHLMTARKDLQVHRERVLQAIAGAPAADLAALA